MRDEGAVVEEHVAADAAGEDILPVGRLGVLLELLVGVAVLGGAVGAVVDREGERFLGIRVPAHRHQQQEHRPSYKNYFFLVL